ncbi:hypothetical protein OG746_20880 [Streptomyces sp. NBC_01016]|uniref:hypothetical protein n=1 Tax=Streptomyces sp. NBC_01016 TaxID=2903720 RepID=UPI00225569F3|nr:hypothetical protein [Streptomyces sp. NBC_01016]MCX4831194.1 hypothetical protein [Streptomyces sp. NBC_01016]
MNQDTKPATQAELETLDKARKAAEAAQAKVAKLEAEEALRRDAAAAKRVDLTRKYDTEFHSRWTELAAKARDSEGAPVDYDPKTMGFLEDLVRFAAGREKRRIVLDHARRAETTLGISSTQSTVPDEREYTLDVVDYLKWIVVNESRRRAAEFADALEAEREAFINGK